MKRITAIVLVLLLCLVSLAQGQAPRFSDGDRVCFLGDSIFHGGKVHSNLLLFYATRFPSQPLSFHNAGVAGDTATESLRRLTWDVQPFKPTVTVVMFGMNDVGRWLYGGDATPAVLEQRDRLLKQHVDSMNRLPADLKAMGSTVILCTPTPFDQTAQTSAGNAKGVDDALAIVAENTRKLATEGGHGLVDFHAAMNRVTHAQQAKDPAFTMMDAPRIHPNDAGHMLMAYLVLKAQDIKPYVARVALDVRDAGSLTADNCTITDVRAAEQGVAFTYNARSLPYPVVGNPAIEWVPFNEDLNQELLIIRNLSEGDYDLAIDGQTVAQVSAAELSKGINLAANPNTPQYKQAAAIAELNEKRRSRENNTLRVFAALEHDVLRPKKVDLANMDDVKGVMTAAIDEEGRNKTWRHSYFINLSKVYYSEKPRQAQIEQELTDMTARMYEMAKPKPHRIQIRRR